eukprot:IDg4598t1
MRSRSPIMTRQRMQKKSLVNHSERKENNVDKGLESDDTDSETVSAIPGIPGAPWIPRDRIAKSLNSESLSPTEDTTNEPRSSSSISYMTTLQPISQGASRFVIGLNSDLITQSEKREAYNRERMVWDEKGAIEIVDRNSVHTNANVIGSHVVYKRKHTGVVKARIVPWGHRDLEKDGLRSDSPCVSPEVLRLLFSISDERRWQIGEMDVAAAYLQAQGFEREIYVLPPKEESSKNILWKLEKAAY